MVDMFELSTESCWKIYNEGVNWFILGVSGCEKYPCTTDCHILYLRSKSCREHGYSVEKCVGLLDCGCFQGDFFAMVTMIHGELLCFGT